MPDPTLTEALKEAYASATPDIIYSTLELRHPAFTQPIRVVRDTVSLTARLESTAPYNPNEYVLFVAMAFDLVKPEVSAQGVPQLTLRIDNVDRSIVASVEAAVETTQPITVCYREYLSSDLTAPQNNPPLTMTILTVRADLLTVTATAGFPDLMNRKFPTLEYETETFPELS